MNAFPDRLARIAEEITLADNFEVVIGRDAEILEGRYYFQIRCWRQDVITGEMGRGYGGKAYLSEHATDSELVQTIFGPEPPAEVAPEVAAAIDAAVARALAAAPPLTSETVDRIAARLRAVA